MKKKKNYFWIKLIKTSLSQWNNKFPVIHSTDLWLALVIHRTVRSDAEEGRFIHPTVTNNWRKDLGCNQIADYLYFSLQWKNLESNVEWSRKIYSFISAHEWLQWLWRKKQFHYTTSLVVSQNRIVTYI